ncbi:hypothetical protein P3W53_14285 [Pseudomonas denitrificans (nom. rej.)]|nr:hypothetical protein [Pseudomonas denitrificans (nom. rej.)]
MTPICTTSWRMFILAILLSSSGASLGCEPNGVILKKSRLITCDTEDNTYVDITPPPPNSLRLIWDIEHAYDIQPRPHKAWPVRGVYWSNGGGQSSRWIEFNEEGVIKNSSDNSLIGKSMGELYYRDAPIWLGGQHVYYAISANDKINPDFAQRLDPIIIINNEKVCIGVGISGSYIEQYRMDSSSTPILSGDCNSSKKYHIGSGEFLVYPGITTAGRTIKTREAPFHWAVQYFNEEESPIIDSLGQCRLFCNGKSPQNKIHNTATGKSSAYSSLHSLDIAPPPENSLSISPSAGEPYAVLPKKWPIRALFNSRSGVFEFDESGNILLASEKQSIHIARLHGKNTNLPLWEGTQEVYQLFDSNNPDDHYKTYDIGNISKAIVISENQACPAQLVSEAYGVMHDDGRFYLNGSCSKSKTKHIGIGDFRIYPEDENQNNPQYWSIQYFKDPISPMLDANGQCWLYCNK